MGSEMNANIEEPLQLPGMGLPIDHELPVETRFLHGMNEWIQRPRLTVRELSMLRLMNALSDKSDWNKKIFNDAIVSKWRDEALSMPLISERAWDWCLAELQDKAKDLESNRFTLTFDTGSRCAKSDNIIDAKLRNELNEAVQTLLRRKEKDWHPNSNDQVLNLVHPSLFPLIYGKSRVLNTDEIGVQSAIEACGRGKTLPSCQKPVKKRPSIPRKPFLEEFSLWSSRFQWLPSEVQFSEQSGTAVRISSYINNLHPSYHQDLYTVIEKIIAKSIPLWNAVVMQDNGLQGRTPPRIQTYGHEQVPPDLPEWSETMERDRNKPGYAETVARIREYLSIPDNPDFVPESWMDPEMEEKVREDTWVEDGESYGVLEWKFKRIRRILHPEPSVAYSYEDWKAGRTGAAVVPPDAGRSMGPQDHNYYDVRLEDKFRKQGLQVIVKLASIELTPEKPEYAGGSWHLEGMMNEHIVATSIYYYDVSNTTESRISFRQEAELDDMEIRYEQDDHEPLSEIFGTESLRDEAAVQELGAITTPQGRLLCFPNTLQHRVEPFSLADRTQPGHRRFLVLWLVDPHYRIISTANVPPQQRHWWEPHALRRVLDRSGLPTELQDMIREETGEWPLGMTEAKELRLELMEERTKLMPSIEYHFDEYNFCEH